MNAAEYELFYYKQSWEKLRKENAELVMEVTSLRRDNDKLLARLSTPRTSDTSTGTGEESILTSASGAA